MAFLWRVSENCSNYGKTILLFFPEIDNENGNEMSEWERERGGLRKDGFDWIINTPE